MSKNFTVNVNNFDGDQKSLSFFFSQIKALQSVKKWKNPQTALYLKSKLVGPALTFMLENETIMNCNDIDQIENAFRDFFITDSHTSNLIEFNNLTMLPQESIKNFAHRLSVLSGKVYTMSTPADLENVKYIKFISSIPSNIRVKLQEEGTKTFPEAVKRANELQQILQNEALLQVNPTNLSVNTITEQLTELSEKINMLSFKQEAPKQNKKSRSPSPRRHVQSDNMRPQYKNRNMSQFNRNRRPFQVLTCQLCRRTGHTASRCRIFLNRNQNRSYNRFQQARSHNLNE